MNIKLFLIFFKKPKNIDLDEISPQEHSVQLEVGHDFYTLSKWQTNFFTQLFVLSKRNFKASLGRILSKMSVSVVSK